MVIDQKNVGRVHTGESHRKRYWSDKHRTRKKESIKGHLQERNSLHIKRGTLTHKKDVDKHSLAITLSCRP